MPQDPEEIGAFWIRKSRKGNEFLSGKINGEEVVAFFNANKKNPKEPDWRVKRSQPREERQRVDEDDPGF